VSKLRSLFIVTTLGGPQTVNLHGNPACQLQRESRVSLTLIGGVPRGAELPLASPIIISDVWRRLVAKHLLLQLTALLRFERQRGGWSGKQARNPDWIPGLFAIAVLTAFDSRQRLLDLLKQLAFAVARAQFERVFFLDRRAVGWIRNDDGLTQMLGGFVGVLKQLALHLLQSMLEVRQLFGVHVVRLARL